MPHLLTKLAYLLDNISEWCGRGIAWLTFIIVIITFIIVLLRYVFSYGSIALQESVSYMHAFVFMLGMGYTLKHEGHVRVDIFYRDFNERHKALIDLLGCLLFLLPLSFFILVTSWDYVYGAWQLKEGSREAAGLPLVYLLKTAIPAMCILLALQGLATLIKNTLILVRSNN